MSVRTNSNGKASVSQQVTFSSPGEIETTIKVYKGSTLVAERTGGSPDMVYARWSINLALNSNHLGTLYFYYASGAQAHHCDAKGKSGKGYTWDKNMAIRLLEIIMEKRVAHQKIQKNTALISLSG